VSVRTVRDRSGRSACRRRTSGCRGGSCRRGVPPPCSPKCMHAFPRPPHVPGAGLVHVPGAGLVHFPRPRVEQSLWSSQRMFALPEHAPRQSWSGCAVQNSPGTLPPAHLPGQSTSLPHGPPGMPPPEQVPGEPESRPPSGGGFALITECRCQSSGTAVPVSWRRKQPAGDGVAPGLAGLLYWQWRPGALAKNVWPQSAAHGGVGSVLRRLEGERLGARRGRRRGAVHVQVEVERERLRNGRALDRNLRPVGEDPPCPSPSPRTEPGGCPPPPRGSRSRR
jgi:hypothetical protein